MSCLLILGFLLVILFLLRFQNIEGFEDSKSITICKADWCGHCKTAAPEFQSLLAASPITLKDGTKAVVKILDADKDKSEIAKHDVKGFPTVIIMNNGKTTEYPGPRTSESIIEYMNSQ